MAVTLPPRASVRPVVVGAAGGVLAAGAGLAVAIVLALAQGHMAATTLNAVGAWWVRWLQVAAPEARDNLYWDASLGGLAIALGMGGLVGAVAGGVWARHPAANALPWGLGLGGIAWATIRWGLAPALNPVLGSSLPAPVLAGACLAYGLVLGGWLAAARPAVADRNARHATAS